MMTIGNAVSWMRSEMSQAETAKAEAAQEIDDAKSKEIFQAAQSSIDASMKEVSERLAEVAAKERTEANARKQAIFDTIYLIAAADGSITPLERAKLVLGIQGLLGDGADEATIDDGLSMARVLREEKGLAGAAAHVASVISEEFERYALLSIGSTVAWLGGGVGAKEGAALQAVSGAFGVPIKVLHQIMASAAAVAKR